MYKAKSWHRKFEYKSVDALFRIYVDNWGETSSYLIIFFFV